jgi:hypothetical protein
MRWTASDSIDAGHGGGLYCGKRSCHKHFCANELIGNGSEETLNKEHSASDNFVTGDYQYNSSTHAYCDTGVVSVDCAGGLMQWHVHTNLCCLTVNGAMRVVGVTDAQRACVDYSTRVWAVCCSGRCCRRRGRCERR